MTTVPELLRENAETYEKKNDDYGDSWRMGGKLIALLMEEAGETDIRLPAEPDAINSFLMWGRRLDKITRAFNGEFLTDEMNFESTEDAHLDESNYAAMHAKLLIDRAEEEPGGYGVTGAEYGGSFSFKVDPEEDSDVIGLLTGGAPNSTKGEHPANAYTLRDQ